MSGMSSMDNYGKKKARRLTYLDLMGKEPCCVSCVASLACVAGHELEGLTRCKCGKVMLLTQSARLVISKQCPIRVLATPVRNVKDYCDACFEEWKLNG